MARLRRSPSEPEGDTTVEARLSANLQARIHTLRSFLKVSNTSGLGEQYEQVKTLFEREVPDADFDTFLGSKLIALLRTIRDAKSRCEPKLKQLHDSSWALTEAAFVENFSQEMLGSYRFLEALVKISKIVSFDEALRVLVLKRDFRLDNPRPGVAGKPPWQPGDVIAALDEIQQQQHQQQQLLQQQLLQQPPPQQHHPHEQEYQRQPQSPSTRTFTRKRESTGDEPVR